MSIINPAFNKNNFEDYEILIKLNKIFKSRRGYDFKLPVKNEAVILLISGGLDSICIWNILLGKFKLHVFPVHLINPGKIYKGEEKSIRYYSKVLEKKYPRLFHKVEFINIHRNFRIKSITSRDIWHDARLIFENLVYNKRVDDYKVSIRYNSNPLFNYFAHVYPYAEKLRSTNFPGLKTVMVCFVPEDRIISRNSTLTVLRSVNLSICSTLGDYSWQFSAAFEPKKLFLPRSILLLFAKKQGILLSNTWTCMLDGPVHCGKCGQCVIRREAFKSIKITDQTKYMSDLNVRESFRKKLKKTLFYFLWRINNLFIYKTILSDNINLNKLKFFLSSDVSWYEKEGIVYLFHKRKGELDVLNVTGSIIWNSLANNPQTITSLIALLKKHYKVRNQELKKDVIKFLKNYTSEGYIYFQKIN